MHSRQEGFSLVEVCAAIAICVLFCAAAFVTNQRLLIALKSQKETTAATMVLQQRMELLRATAFSNIASSSYLQNSILANRTGSEGPLGNLAETITVSTYPPNGSNISVQRDPAHPSGTVLPPNGSLSSAALLRVDVLLDWTSANGRSRTRQLSSIFGIGNIAP